MTTSPCPPRHPGHALARALRPPLLAGAALVAFLLAPPLPAATPSTTAVVQEASVNGGIQDGKARLVIEAQLTPTGASRETLLFASTLQHAMRIGRDGLTHTIEIVVEVLQGEPRELVFLIDGDADAEITQVRSESLLDWSVRRAPSGQRSLVLRPKPVNVATNPPPATKSGPAPATVPAASPLKIELTARQPRPEGWGPVPTGSNPSIQAFTLTPAFAALGNGWVRVETDSDLEARALQPAGLIPIEPKFLPESLRPGKSQPDDPAPLAYRFHGTSYRLPLAVSPADPEAQRVVLRDFQLRGQLGAKTGAGDATITPTAAFTLTAVAQVRNPRGGRIEILSGDAALTELTPAGAAADGWRLRHEQGRFLLVFDRAGEFPIRLQFHAAVRPTAGWNRVEFRVAPSAMQPVALEGLRPETQFEFAGAARPERRGDAFVSHLPPDGAVRLAWKESRPEAEGRLFYSIEMLGQVAVSPGLLRQQMLLEGRVMQGELSRLTLRVRGDGSVTRVQGRDLLSWNLEPTPPGGAAGERRLVVQFNQPQKEAFSLLVQLQTELGTFPQAVNAVLLQPDGATRVAGHLRVVNDGAVRLEVVQSTGLSQVSPDQFPESDATRSLFSAPGSQRFAFRFADPNHTLRIQADNVLPEIGVSHLLTYHLGDTEQSVEAELELDIREAPVRELLVRMPRGFAIARLQAPGLADYFTADPPADPDTELRLVYAQPVVGRQVIQLRLERNAAPGDTNWALPRVEVSRAKSTRGHVGVSADPGFRLTPIRTQGLTEIATAFHPRRLAGIQAAFRLSDPAWQATLRVERLPQSVLADVFHLFSVGEGIGYGSSTMNFLIAGAPIATFRVELSDEYFNVEFTGKDVRNWQKTTNGYVVQLHTPVAGAYTLLATYERPFKAQGDTLTFTGARPLDAQSEQGHTLIVSAYQFNTSPANVSPGLTELETAEVPSEYRLFTDAPILKAYRYTTRPFNLQLRLERLAQGETLSLVADRATLVTRVSKGGEVVTDARYFVKNRGNTHFRLSLPPDTELWSATVNGSRAVPVRDGQVHLIPLAQHADPNTVQTVDLKLAARSPTPARVRVAAPIIHAPLLLADWRLEPDTGQRLAFVRGSLAPARGVPDRSGFAGLARLISGPESPAAVPYLVAALAGLGLATLAWRWSVGRGSWRFSIRHAGGGLVGLAAFALAVFLLAILAEHAASNAQPAPRDLAFLAPIQQGGSSLALEIRNEREGLQWPESLALAWPALAALVVGAWWWRGPREGLRLIAPTLAWTLLAWATLRWPNGAPGTILLLIPFALAHLAWPALRQWLRTPRRPKPNPQPETPTPANTATSTTGPAGPAGPSPALPTALLLASTLAASWLFSPPPAQAAANPGPAREPAIADAVLQEIRVEDRFVFATARIRWQARRDQWLPVLFEPAVATRFSFPSNALTLVQVPIDASGSPAGRRAFQLIARESGPVDIEIGYQLPVSRTDGESAFVLPTAHGLVNRVTLTLTDVDAEVTSDRAVSIETLPTQPAAASPAPGSSSSRHAIVLLPAADARIRWKPRSRDARREKAVFFADLTHVLVPSAGVVEGAHYVQIRPAQGELAEVLLEVPTGATITDVLEAAPGSPANQGNQRAAASPIVSLWRFDPDARTLRISLNPPQSRPFGLWVRSQSATGPLPFEQSLRLPSITNAASQIALVGIATGQEVQLDAVTAAGFTSINLEDFPTAALAPLQGRFPGLTVRRAFRAPDARGSLTVKAAPVEPDIRVETQETLSIGEDRTVLAANLAVAITRAGIFRLSFPLPAGLEVEAISGSALSHWTELAGTDGRIVTLHLRGRTDGDQTFSISLAGSGLRATNGYVVPRLALREAAKQRGQLVIVPEQGLRPQIAARDGVTQLDPQKAGIRQKGVLAFRLLQSPWSLTLDLQQVDAWVQVTSLQHATLGEAHAALAANLQYQIENTGLKSLQVRLPTNATSVRFRGDQVADFLPVPGSATNGMQTWEIKLHRRMLGRYLLQVSCQIPFPTQATNVALAGIQALEVNLQRGFFTLQSAGRLQIRVPTPPPALQPAEWQSIPRPLQQDLPTTAANHTFRVVEPAFLLPLTLERHEAARLLPARVSATTLRSVVADDGGMLTQVRLDLVPGDKRLLRVTLPPNAQFWFAFVNQAGVWPWLEQNAILIPLEQQSRTDTPIAVEVFYSSRVSSGAPSRDGLALALEGPRFDLPLENISWQVHLNDKWHLNRWQGTLQLEEDSRVTSTTTVDVQAYLQGEAAQNLNKTRQAESLLSLGNSLLEKGDPTQARRAFQSAFGLSTHDSAFNEDARVQLHNLKLQQALLGLNVRQSAVAGESDAAPSTSQAQTPTQAQTANQAASPTGGKFGDLRQRKDAAYTQQEAKQIIEGNSAEQNEAFLRVAERLVQQQDAALAAPAAIRAAIPQQGRVLTFKRSVQVDPMADLRLSLETQSAQTAPRALRFALLAALMLLLGTLAWATHSLRRKA